MRSLGLIGALFIAAPLAAQSNKFRTDDPVAAAKSRAEAAAAAAAAAQRAQTSRDVQNGRRRNDKIPPGQMPPAGMCRIWIDGVPPGQQPAPTDCQTAVATKPANARILFNDQSTTSGRGKGKFKSHEQDNDDDDNGSAIGSTNRRGNDDDVNEDRASNDLSSRSISQSSNQRSRSSHGRHKGDD